MKTILVITDRVGTGLTNGSQVFANALLCSLSREMELRVITCQREGAAPELHSLVLESGASDEQVSSGLLREVELDGCDLFYNLGGTSFSCRISLLLSQLRPAIPLVNHFQVNLAAYARNEGTSQETCLEEGRIQSTVAAKARRNIFSSFSELRMANEQGWQCAHACVVPNAYVNAGSVLKSASRPTFTFFGAGRFSDYVKGADLLYRAFAGLSAGLSRLEIAADQGRFLEILRSCPSDSWTFHSWLTRGRRHQAMGAANCVVVPSRYEPFGLVAIEAMAAGTPVIAMAVGGLAEIVEHGVTGWLCPPEEGSLGLRLAMEQALADPERTRWMGQNARRAVRHEYSLAKVSQLVAKHLRNTAANSGCSLVNQWASGSSQHKIAAAPRAQTAGPSAI